MSAEPPFLEKGFSEKTGFDDVVSEIWGVVLTTASAFALLCLISYSPEDPSFSSLSYRQAIHNYGGVIGSYLSDLFLQGFGGCAFLLAAFLLGFGIYCFICRPTKKRADRRQFIIQNNFARAGICLTIFIAFCTFVSIVAQDHKLYQGAIHWGGAVGRFFELLLVEYFNFVGTLLLIISLIVAGLLLITPFSVRTFARTVGELMVFVGRNLWAVTWIAYEAVRNLVSAYLNARRAEKQSQEKKALFSRILSRLRKRDPATTIAPPLEVGLSAGVQEEPSVQPVGTPKWEEIIAKAKRRLSGHSDQKAEKNLVHEKTNLELPLNYSNKKEQAGPYRLPALSLLAVATPSLFQISQEELMEQAQRLEQKLMDYGVSGRVVDVHPGPVITLYEFEPVAGVKVKNIVNLTDDLKMALRAVSVRIIAPIPGKAAVGIEIPNAQKQTVLIRDILASEQFQKQNSLLTLVFGKTTSGEPFAADLRKMPHLLIAGATGSGKSVGINTMICSILYKATPDQVRFIMIDPKMLELSMYEGIPQLLLPVVTDPRKATRALRWAVREMERRYHVINLLGARNIQGYNLKVERLSAEELRKERERARELERFFQPEDTGGDEKSADGASPETQEPTFTKLPYIVIVIDELADLIMISAGDVEESITRLAQMARAAGIHLIVATQRPSVDVITGLIKANFPARISYQVSSRIDSRTILDTSGAECLLGDGDMLYLPPGTSRLQRIHGALVTEDEIERIVSFLKSQGLPSYDSTIVSDMAAEDKVADESEGQDADEMYEDAIKAVLEMKNPSVSLLQRRLRIGYNRAARMIEMMERDQIISSPLPSGKGREVLMRPTD